MRWRVYWIPLIVVSVIMGCSGHKKLTQKKGSLIIPAGVDSDIAQIADSTAQQLFVEFDVEDEADKLKEDALQSMIAADTVWNFLKIISDNSKDISKKQRQQAVERFNHGAVKLKKIMALQKKINRKGINSKTINELRLTSYNLLMEAKQDFEESIRLNPFDLETRDALSWVLWKLVQYFENKKANIQLVDVLTELVALDKGEHHLYFRLGQAFHSLKQWNKALDNFKDAERVLLEYPGTPAPDTTITQNQKKFLSKEDSLNLYTYIYYQGDALAEMFNADQALERFQVALNYTNSPEQRQIIYKYINWIEWDDGNIRASKIKDKILDDYYKDNNHKKAVRNLKKLLRVLRKQQSKDEINWRIARIQFSGLNQLEPGIDRLSKIVYSTEKNAAGCPVDTSYNRYFEDLAIMCNNIAMHNLTNRLSRKFAYTYLLQAVQIHSSIRGKLYVELAKLTNNNPETCIKNCLEAFKYINPEDTDNITLIMKYLTNSYRRMAQKSKVKLWYSLWKQLKLQQWKDMHYGISNAFSREPEICIRWSEYTLEQYKNQLSKKETEYMYVLLINSYKSLQNREMTEYWINNLRTIRGAN